MQLTLDLLPRPGTHLDIPRWNELDPSARAQALQILVRLIAKASMPQPPQKGGCSHDD